VRTFFLLIGALLATTAADAADLGVADLPRVHAEYKANQARWAREFLDKTFAATMTLDGVSNVFSNESFYVTFLESPSDSWPGVACRNAPASDFLVSKNKGENIFLRGVVKDHSSGTLDLRDCEFFDSERAAADADAKHLAEDAESQASAAKEAAAAAEAQRLSDEASARVQASHQLTSVTILIPPPAKPDQPTTRSDLPGPLNDTFRGMIEKTGKRCNAITDHVWVTSEHLSIMCDRRLRAAFIHEPDGWRFGRPGE
jgi:hypothetical protein